jgi:hypothetical protein
VSKVAQSADLGMFERKGKPPPTPTPPQWANYRGQADIGFFKIFDFMVDMALFNIQTNNKIIIFPFSKKNVQKFWFLKSELKKNQILQLG